MVPVVSIVGRSNVGKTTLIEKLIGTLRGKGYRIATMKHNRHGFDIDHEGKDSWRHKQAGACMTLIASPGKVALVKDIDGDSTIDSLRQGYVRNVDLIITEGFRGNPYPKIGVFRSDVAGSLETLKEEKNIIAIASDMAPESCEEWFELNDIDGITRFIQKHFLQA